MDGVVQQPRSLALLRREAPIHALMIAVMASAMLSGSRAAALAGAGILVGAAVWCAVLSRRSGHFAAQCVDLWAMALGMLALMSGPASGHHGSGVPSILLFTAVSAGWVVARVALAVRRGTRWPRSVASAGLTAAGLLVMLALH